jgi:hypothetical protein
MTQQEIYTILRSRTFKLTNHKRESCELQFKEIHVIRDHTGHTHFEMQIGPNSDDTIEVVYNQSFGELPPLNPGMEVEVCGDYITTANQGHGSSPDGAIIHWVHKSPAGNGHPSGYVAVNGVVYGDGDGNGN